jgi:Inner membrane component of T3SS, cytoplasmic domain
MAKFCGNGHQMEDSWAVCPYCQRTGFRGAGIPPGGKTRLEAEPPKEAPPAAPSAGRKTVLLTERRKPRVVGWFVALTGDQIGEDFRVRDGQNVIGSAPEADIVLRDTAVSGKHASLRYKDQKFFLTDLDSANGTYLNDGPNPIAREELKDNDIVRIGEVSLKFKCF